jgi:SsrA-binding protein
MEFIKKVNVKNKKAYFDYEIDEKFTAGMVLTGTEIKTIRLGKASLVDSYCFFIERELYIKGMNIGTYDPGTHYNHMPIRDRKLLLKKIELKKLQRKVKEKGFTIIPLLLFLSDSGYAKLEVGLAKGKREYDKRETLKTKDVERELDRARKR